ncbi:MAG TPA: NADPH-dependent assimilatory sulfite reductase hemoprotein subunit [Candidatus Binatia bacterium]|nr:NADPH-dependent assimilatory sulfite reductase hemoprotein subunit [Candidatus Binatia bacterium]
MARKTAPSGVEAAKLGSNNLRGRLAEEIEGASDHLSEESQQLLKFHGAYQQDDRDRREATRTVDGPGERAYSFMVRVKIPGGMLSADQYLAMDRLAGDVVRGQTLRVTTRQNFQLHGVIKSDLAGTIRRVNDCLLTTLSGCGDVERNIVAPPAPLADEGHRALRALALELTEALTPMSRAYHEIWLGADKVDSSQESEPLYGKTYLPRKFKTGLALPDDDSVEVLDQDCALIGLVTDGRLQRLNVALGGGGGLTHRKPDSYARLATPLGSVAIEDAVETVRIVASIFRDFGDRTDRKHARLKHVVEELGIDAVAEEFRRRARFSLHPWVPIGTLRRNAWLGRHDQRDGRCFVGVAVASGRITDAGPRRIKTAFAAAVAAVRPGIVLTPQQNVLFTDMTTAEADHLEEILRAHGVATGDSWSPVRRATLSCPAMPTCGLALAEAERIAPSVIDALEHELARVGKASCAFDLRITGCANGCVRTYNADLGLVGRKPGHYDLYVGGSSERLGELYAEQVRLDDVASSLRPLLEAWAGDGRGSEAFGDFYWRRFGRRQRRDLLTGAKEHPARDRVLADLDRTGSDGKVRGTEAA